MPRVNLPDGSVANFPDGMAPNDIQSAIEQHMQQHIGGAKPSAPVAVPPVQAVTPPPDHQSLLSKAWGWANAPVNIGHLRESLDQSKADSESAPSLADADHPILSTIRKGVEGFGADAGKMLLTPLSLGMAAAGPIAAGTGKAALAAKTALTAAGLGFGAQGGADIYQHGITPMPGEKPEDYVRRVGGDAAMLTGGAAGVAEVPHLTEGLRGGVARSAPTTTPAAPSTEGSIAPADVVAQKGATRKGQALGSTKVPVSRTVHIDPDFANELTAWNSNTTLPGKRIILRKNGTMDLAHTDPDTPGFQFTDTNSNNAFSDEGAAGQVPVELSQQNGTRGTVTPGHYLSNQIVGDAAKQAVVSTPQAPPAEAPPPQAATPATSAMPSTPEIAPAAPAEVSPLTPQNPAAPALSVNDRAIQGFIPPTGVNPVRGGFDAPESASPVQLFGDTTPVKEAATNTGNSNGNPAASASVVKRFKINELTKEVKEETPTSPVSVVGDTDTTPRGGVAPGGTENSSQSSVKSSNLTQNSASVVEPQRTSVTAEEGTPKTPMSTSAAVESQALVRPEVSTLEEKIRPLVGQALQLSRIKVGEAASHAIDTAMEQSRTSGGKIPEDVAGRVSRLLKEPVGNVLTPEQVTKLEALRGGKLSEEPKVTFLNRAAVESKLEGPDFDQGEPPTWTGEPYKRHLEASQDAMMGALSDPNTSPATLEKIKSALFDTDSAGRPKYAVFEHKLQYPEPSPIDPSHPEAPFTGHQLGHEIAPITLKNLTAALGKQPRTLFLETSKSDPHVTPQERVRLAELRQQETPGRNPSEMLSEIIGTPDEEGNGLKGSVFEGRSRNQEYQEYERTVQQNSLSRKLNSVQGALKSEIGRWNNLRQGAPTELTAQLAKLSPDARKYLPEELFHESTNESTSPGSVQTPGAQQPAQSADASKATATGIKSRQETPVAGIKTTKYDGLIEKNFPNAAHLIDTIQQRIQREIGVAGRQKAYLNAMTTLHNYLLADDPFAIKKAMDATPDGGTQEKGGGLGAISPDAFRAPSKNYTAEELHTINSTVADNILQRYERMSDSELAKKKEGLRKDELINRIKGSAPSSEIPDVRQQQAETYAELKDRYDELRKQAGPSANLHDKLVELVDAWNQKAQAKQLLRSVRGTQFRDNTILAAHFNSLDRLMDQLPLPEQDRFFDNMSRGDAQSDQLFSAVDPKFLQKWESKNGPVPDPNAVAASIRSSLDEARDRVTQTSGNLQDFILNYMPGMYENQARARAFADSWASRRPLAGNSDFLKQKMYEFHSDALKAGLQPTTSNPVRAMLMRNEQLNRFSMAHEFKNKLVGDGLTEWYNTGETPPEGHEQLNDRIFGQGGLGGYWAPSSVARTFNNFVSAGLTGGWKVPYTNLSLYDAVRHTNNLANQMQLGFSLFHGVETMLNSGFSTMALGLKQALNQGKVLSGAGNMAKGLTFVAPIIEDAWNGAKGLGNFRDPTKNLNYAELGNDLERANANAQGNPEFKLNQIEKLKKNWATATDSLMPTGSRAWAGTKAATNLLGSAVEATSWPLMNYLIPRVKVGAFYKMAQQIHEEYAGQAPEVIDRQLQSAWDSVDNRFGQVNYDNMFMNKVTRDIATIAVRSPGWNIGTIREVGGGVLDLGESAVSAAQGKGLKISNRTAYAGAMVMGTMWVNAIYQYLHTGEAPKGMDYFFPKDGTRTVQGEDNRMYPKTYVYDFINMSHDPINTVWHKSAPIVSTTADLIKNEDYYHHEIRDPGASPVANAKATLGYLAHQFVPFSIGNMQETALRNQNSKMESIAGILPAPRWVGRSNAENLAFDYFKGTQASGGQDEWSLEHKTSFIKLRNQVAQGKVSDEQIGQAIADGKINPKMVKYLYQTVNKPNLQTWTEKLTSPQQVWNVWNAATPTEKQTLFPSVIKKMASETSGDEQQKYLGELQDWADKHPQ